MADRTPGRSARQTGVGRVGYVVARMTHQHSGERTGFLSAEEVAAVQHLHKRAPYSITGISHGFFSVARHYGGMDYNGCRYVYVPEHDECVRADVHKLVAKMRKPKKQQPAAQQLALIQHSGEA